MSEQFDKESDVIRQRVKALEAIEAVVMENITDYEWRGETDDGREGCYSPTAQERALIADAIAGLHADSDFVRAWDAWRALCRAPSAGVSLLPIWQCPECNGECKLGDKRCHVCAGYGRITPCVNPTSSHSAREDRKKPNGDDAG